MNYGRVALEPFAQGALMHLDLDGFREAGGPAALVGFGRSHQAGFGTLGLRAATGIFLSDASTMTLRGMLGWRLAFGDVLPSSAMAFASGSQTFAITGAPIARHSLVAEAGLDWVFRPNATLGVTYSGARAHHAQDHAVKGNLTWRF